MNAMKVETLNLYLYGVIPNSPGCLDGDLRGTEDCPLHLVTCRDLAVITSETMQTRFRPQRHLLVAHTRVLEQAIARGLTVLPIRFGTSASSAERVVDRWLGPRYEELTALIARMAGHYEMGLRVMGDRQKLIEDVANASSEIQKLRAGIAGRPAAETYYERIQIGSRIQQELAVRRQAYQDSILAALSPLAAATRINDTLGDAMLLNAALLIPAARETAYDAALEQMQAGYPEHLQFRNVSRVPPYNFVDLEVNIRDD